MSFEISIQPIDINLAVPSDADLEAGANALMIQVTMGMILPFQSGPGQPPIIAPLGIVKFPMAREQAEDLAVKLAEESQKLPKAPSSSGLEVATSLEGIDKVQNFADKLKNPRGR